MISIDTCVVLWGIQGVLDPTGRGMGERSKLLLQQRDRDNVEVLIPFPAVVESMAKIPTREHQAYIDRLKQRYVLGIFEEDSALKAAQLQRVMGAEFEVGKHFGVAYSALKIDIQIAAIAMTYGATALYTDNVKDFQTLILEDNFRHQGTSRAVVGCRGSPSRV